VSARGAPGSSWRTPARPAQRRGRRPPASTSATVRRRACATRATGATRRAGCSSRRHGRTTRRSDSAPPRRRRRSPPASPVISRASSASSPARGQGGDDEDVVRAPRRPAEGWAAGSAARARTGSVEHQRPGAGRTEAGDERVLVQREKALADTIGSTGTGRRRTAVLEGHVAQMAREGCVRTSAVTSPRTPPRTRKRRVVTADPVSTGLAGKHGARAIPATGASSLDVAEARSVGTPQVSGPPWPTPGVGLCGTSSRGRRSASAVSGLGGPLSGEVVLLGRVGGDVVEFETARLLDPGARVGAQQGLARAPELPKTCAGSVRLQQGAGPRP
jgi:hypothetical protein